MCIALPEPHEWEFNGRSGVKYQVEVSDGTESMKLTCDSPETYYKFEVFKTFDIKIRLIQRAEENKNGIVKFYVNPVICDCAAV